MLDVSCVLGRAQNCDEERVAPFGIGSLAGAVAAAALAFGLSAAPAAAQEESDDAEEGEVEILEDYDLDTVIATVQGEEITLGDLFVARADLPPQVVQILPSEQLYEGLLEQAIRNRLAAIAGEESGVADTDAVQDQLAAARALIVGQAYVLSVIEPQMTEEALRERYEAEIVATFDSDAEEINARHILVATEEEALEVIAQLEGGADFATLAQELSVGPSGPNGGDLGYFQEGQMVAEFNDAAFALEVDEISAPVETQFGWHVITVVDRRAVQPPAFEEVVDQIRETVFRELLEAEFARLLETATIERSDPRPPYDAIKDDSLLAPAEE